MVRLFDTARILRLAAIASATSLVLLVACSSGSEDATPTRVITPTQDAAADTAADAPPVDPGCLGADQCFKCDPQTIENFLNACTDGTCTKFDNLTRLPLFKPGEALPPVP
ncbi:MAG: hypothetical protein JWM74_5152 [Myxococcaceae bacterium]|nr:hypothetical protein [Myxococcaceae bacterium]